MFRTSSRLRTLPRPICRPAPAARALFSRSRPRFEHASLNPYKVRFRNPGLTPRRLATFALYSTCFTAYLWYFVPEVEVEVEIQEGDQHAARSADFVDAGSFGQEDYAEDDSFFIPLTWAWKLPRTYYKGSDPEWQEFVKVAKDQPRHKRINREFVL